MLGVVVAAAAIRMCGSPCAVRRLSACQHYISIMVTLQYQQLSAV
jgi:hypothetical protein